MKCFKCGADDIQEKVRFCIHCGEALAVATPLEPEPGDLPGIGCPTCGVENRATARFCLTCGLPLASPSSPSSEPEPEPEPEALSEPEPEMEPLPPEPPIEAESLAICPSCGANNRPIARFCLECGQAMAPAGPEEPTSGEFAPSLAAEPELPLGEAAQPPEAEQEPAAEPGIAIVEPEAGPESEELPPEPETEASSLEMTTLPPEEMATPEQQIEVAEPVPPAGKEPDTSAEEDKAAIEQPEPPVEKAPGPLTAPPALEEGAEIASRYRIVGVLPTPDEGGNLYAVADLGHCWSCNWSVDDPTQAFCTECGADVTQPPAEHRPHLRETMVPVDTEELPDGAFVHGERLYEPVALGPAPPDLPFPYGVRLAMGHASDSGQVRELDEDSVFVLNLTGLYQSHAEGSVGLAIVADGMGGHEGGEWASRLAAQTIAEVLLQDVILRVVSGEETLPLLEEAIHDHLRRAVEAANQRVFHIRTGQESDMGTTVTLALILDDLAYIANVGDSRTYLWGWDGLEQVTADHSLVASLVDSGMAQPEEVYTHPQRSAIYRSLGDKPDVQVDVFTRSLAPGNVLVLCCDGVWEMVRDEGIEEVLLQGLPPQATCDELVRRANLAGGEDNISAVVVRVENNG